jgi:hypothetical protein
MIEISDAAVLEIALIMCIIATISGLVQGASVIFEFDGYYREQGLNVHDSQLVKRNKFMPRLRAPMYQAFLGEIFLFVILAFVSLQGLGHAIMILIVVAFLIIILLLAGHFYRAGRSEMGSLNP